MKKPLAGSLPLMKEKKMSNAEELYAASQWKLMWVKFKDHKLATIGLIILGFFYSIALFAPIIAPYDPWSDSKYIFSKPTEIHFFHEGNFIGPFVYAKHITIDLNTFERTFIDDTSRIYPVRFFVHGSTYEWLFFINSDIHLFGLDDGERINLWGTDQLGRDCFSRNVWGSQISLTIGIVGVFFTFILGCIIGGLSGYYGGTVDVIIQRIMEFVTCIPTIPMWMALSATIPPELGNVQTYFLITIILALRSWTGLSRQVRSKLLQLREEDFVIAAKVAGTTDWQIIITHLLPGFSSYLIVSLTIAIPRMILGETALSFLSLGLKPPTISWGVLLQDSQNLASVAIQTWLLAPAVLVIISVWAFNFIGDGLRDAADPYKN